MNNNYFAFSTAPGAHAGGAPVTSMLGHPSKNISSGLIDGKLPQLGTGSPGGLASGGSGSSLLAYSGPPSQQQQQHSPHLSRLSGGNTPMFPSSFHPLPGANPNAAAVNASNANGVGGPAVPAPRSTAALIAEVTGAPQPLPATSAPGGAMGISSSGVNSPSMHMATPPAPPSGHLRPMSAAAVGGGSGAVASGVGPASPSFESFTTSAAKMLSKQDSAGLYGNSDGGFSGADVAVVSSLVDAARGGESGVAPIAVSDGQNAEQSLYSHVEIQFTLGGFAEGGDASHQGDGGAATWDPTLDEDDPLDSMGYLLTSIGCPTEDAGYEPMSDTMDMDEGARHSLNLFYNRAPRASATLIMKYIADARSDVQRLRLTLRAVTLAIISTGEYKVILLLPKPEALTLRLAVLQYLLARIMRNYRARIGEDLDKDLKNLTTLASLRLVSAAGLVTMIDIFLQREELKPAGLRLLTFALSEISLKQNIREMLEQLPRVAERLRELYTQSRQHEVDVALITRLWQQATPVLYGSLPLQTTFKQCDCPVTCMAYFRVRDEFITGHMNGSVVLWGGPQMTKEKPYGSKLGLPRPGIRPRGVVPLPLNCVPVAMAGQRIDGQYLAIAGMPYKSRKPYLRYCNETKATAAAGAALAADATDSVAHAAAKVGTITIITCNENSIQWNKGEVIQRPAGVALTAITAFRNSIVAVGESLVLSGATAAVTLPHRLTFVDVTCGTVMRQIPKAHDDYITALNVLDEGSYVLLSGGRDAAVKLWDPRSREDTPVVNTALCTTAATHKDTITALCATGYNIVSTAVDGSIVVWDLRAMEAPQLRHELDYPIVDAAVIGSKCAIAATSRGLITMSLDMLLPLDMRYYQKGYSHVMTNSTNELVFTASCSGEVGIVAVYPS